MEEEKQVEEVAIKQAAKKKATKRRPSKKKRSKKSAAAVTNADTAWRAWTFPKETLEQALNIPKAIEEKHAGNPMSAADLAKAVGFKQSVDWRFLDLLRSSPFNCRWLLFSGFL